MPTAAKLTPDDVVSATVYVTDVDDFIATAALNSDGKIAVVVLNLQNHETFMRVWLHGKFVKYQCPPNATITFILQPV